MLEIVLLFSAAGNILGLLLAIEYWLVPGFMHWSIIGTPLTIVLLIFDAFITVGYAASVVDLGLKVVALCRNYPELRQRILKHCTTALIFGAAMIFCLLVLPVFLDDPESKPRWRCTWNSFQAKWIDPCVAAVVILGWFGWQFAREVGYAASDACKRWWCHNHTYVVPLLIVLGTITAPVRITAQHIEWSCMSFLGWAADTIGQFQID